MAGLDQDLLDSIFDAALKAGLTDDGRRPLLLDGLPRNVTTALPTKGRPRDQLLSDLQQLARLTVNDGPALRTLLRNAARLAVDEQASAAFTAALDRLGRLAPVPAVRLAAPPDVPPLSPDSPYPLLEPIRRADQFGGRGRELMSLLHWLSGDRPLLAIYAPSGYGKSSLLIAGILPSLQDARVPVSMNRMPCAPDIAYALIDAIVANRVPRFEGPAAFEDWLERIGRSAGHPPVFLLDQFEEVFKGEEQTAVEAQRRVGVLISATARIGSVGGRPLCRWVLAYRQEFHGDVERWLRDAFVGGEPPLGLTSRILPHQTWAWPLEPLGVRDPRAAFLDAITRPLVPHDTKPWRFAEGHAERLAEVFAEARAAQPRAPLLPELQVVLRECVVAANGGELRVPEETGDLVDGALRRHLLAVLRDTFVGAEDPITERTLAAIALQRLVDDNGQALAEGLSFEGLLPTVGVATLEQLSAWDARLVVAVRGEDGETRLRLSHDRLAAIVAGLDDAELFGKAAGIDAGLVHLNRLVGQRAAQWAETRDEATLSVSLVDAARVGKHAERLLWNDDRRRWWKASRERARRRRSRLSLVVVALFALVVATAWTITHLRRQARLQQSLAQFTKVSAEAGESVLAQVDQLMRLGAPDTELNRLIAEKQPWTAAFAAADQDSEAARERIIRVLLGELAAGGRRSSKARDFGHLVAGLRAALHPDTPGREWWTEKLAKRHKSLKMELHHELRRQFGEPSSDIQWVTVLGGSFRMGQKGNRREEPVHMVTVDSFQILRHEVVREQWSEFDLISMAEADDLSDIARKLSQVVKLGDRYPMWGMDWYEANAFAAWLDPEGSLPTEAQWEYATRGGRNWTDKPYWSGGIETLNHVGTHWGNRTPLGVKPVCELQDSNEAVFSHPLRLCDVHGGQYEWTADYYNLYAYGSGDPRSNPDGPRRGSMRSIRGGSWSHAPSYARSAARDGVDPLNRFVTVGFRPVRPVSTEKAPPQAK